MNAKRPWKILEFEYLKRKVMIKIFIIVCAKKPWKISEFNPYGHINFYSIFSKDLKISRILNKIRKPSWKKLTLITDILYHSLQTATSFLMKNDWFRKIIWTNHLLIAIYFIPTRNCVHGTIAFSNNIYKYFKHWWAHKFLKIRALHW